MKIPHWSSVNWSFYLSTWLRALFTIILRASQASDEIVNRGEERQRREVICSWEVISGSVRVARQREAIAFYAVRFQFGKANRQTVETVKAPSSSCISGRTRHFVAAWPAATCTDRPSITEMMLVIWWKMLFHGGGIFRSFLFFCFFLGGGKEIGVVFSFVKFCIRNRPGLRLVFTNWSVQLILKVFLCFRMRMAFSLPWL